MDLKSIEMDRTEAKRAFIEYKNAVHERHDAEDEEIMRGYRELARGRQVLHLTQTIAAAGADELGRPKLACLRACAEWCWLEVRSNGGVVFMEERWRPRAKARSIELQAGTLPARSNWLSGVRAMVPPVPPRFRPKAELSNFHVLWEAEWSESPPEDPALLKHIGGDLYAVLAVWDLTELERSVLTRRFGQ